MNQRIAKTLRKVLAVELKEPESKRIYRKFKKQYTRLPIPEKKEFLDRLELLHKQYNK